MMTKHLNHEFDIEFCTVFDNANTFKVFKIYKFPNEVLAKAKKDNFDKFQLLKITIFNKLQKNKRVFV